MNDLSKTAHDPANSLVTKEARERNEGLDFEAPTSSLRDATAKSCKLYKSIFLGSA